MEPVGSSGLPPLLPAVPIPVPVADTEQAEEQVVQACSLTELVPVRSKQHTSASDRILATEEELVDDPQEMDLATEMQEDHISSSEKADPKTVEVVVKKFESVDALPEDPKNDEGTITPDLPCEALSETASETHSEANSEPRSGTPTFQVPPHLLGRTVENPAADVAPGRRVQKPRLGVRVPYRNLTSQIVTQNEIAQEIFERTAKKHPNLVGGLTEGAGGIANTEIFTRTLTQRLCSSITPPAGKSKTVVVPESIGALKALLPNKQPAAAAAIVDGLRLSPGFTYNEKEKAMDDAELLSILEGDGDPLWLPEKLLRKTDNAAPATSPTVAQQVSVPIIQTPVGPPTPKLDPAVEKELALKQLKELPIAFPSKKPEKKEKSEKDKRTPSRKKPTKVKTEPNGEEGLLEAAADVVIPEQAAELANGGNAENAPPSEIIPSAVDAPPLEIAPPALPIVETPVKKLPSSRKRKMTPEVEAVLKKPKLTKKGEAVANKAKGVKTIPNHSTESVVAAVPVKAPKSAEAAESAKVAEPEKPAEPAKVAELTKTPESGRKKAAGSRKTSQSKTAVEPVVTNGNAEKNNKKKAKRASKGKLEEVPAIKGKPEEVTPIKGKPEEITKKPAAKASPAKTAKASKGDIKNKNSSPKAQAPSPKHQKSTEVANEAIDQTPKDQLMDVDEQAAPTLVTVQEPAEPPSPLKKPSRINRELEHLLGDEGAVNMLYAVEGHKHKVTSKDLARRARLVKTAVMRLSTNPQGHMRARRSMNVTEPPKLVRMGGNRKQRNHSSESVESMRSPPYLTPADGVSSHIFSPRQKLTADDSRIIRRHSSSSSFSSPSVSPRRVSVEENNMQSAAAGTSSSPRKKGVPIFIRDKAKALTYEGKKKPKVVNPVALDTALIKEKLLKLQSKKSNLLPNPAALKTRDLRKINSEVNGMASFKKGLEGSVSITAKKIAKLRKAQLLAQKKAAEEIAKAEKAAAELLQVQQDEELENEVVLPVAPAAIKQEGKKNSAPLSPDAASETCECPIGSCVASCATCVTGPLFCMSPTGYSNLLKSLQPKGKSAHAEERLRTTARHCAGTYNYKEITVRRYDNVVHVILSPVSTKMSSAFNIQVLRELQDALQQVRKDDQCKVVLLTSSGSIFCQGIDLSALIHNNNEKRKTAAFEMSLALKDFLKCIAHFPKPLIAGVQGAAVGLGVTMLPLFDMVFASDTATFHTPYAHLGQVPEGGATLTLPQMLGHTATSELLLNCRKMTANEALQCGLVTRVLWPDRFMEELTPIIKKIAQQSSQSMEATKALLRHGLRTKFDAALESETHLLVTHWTSKECQSSYQNWIDNGEVSLQRTI